MQTNVHSKTERDTDRRQTSGYQWGEGKEEAEARGIG